MGRAVGGQLAPLLAYDVAVVVVVAVGEDKYDYNVDWERNGESSRGSVGTPSGL